VAQRDGRCLLVISTGRRNGLSAVTARVAHLAPVPVVVTNTG